MRKIIKFIMVLAFAISMPLEGFAAVLPACALMSQSDTKMNTPMQQMQVQQTTAQTDMSKSQNCNCDCKQLAGKVCGQSVSCAGCVTAIAAVFYHVSVALLSANIYVSGPQMNGPPLIASSHFRPPIIASA